MLQKIQKTKEFLAGKINFVPKAGIILGTGLNGLAEIVEDAIVIPYEEIPGFVKSTAPSHQGQLIAGKINGTNVLMFQGRYHFYEGYDMKQVTYPVYVMKSLGVETMIVTNASGSLNEKMKPGDLVLINNHINFMGTNPLIGPNVDEFGERFPSLHDPYTETIRKKIHKYADENGILIHDGVYTAVTGPSLETKAECHMFAKLGSDLVGMSTVPEVISAVHCGLDVLGISVVTNYGNIFHSERHTQEEIRRNAGVARMNLQFLITKFLGEIS
jgi:purine-nucleoside phosphorylase